MAAPSSNITDDLMTPATYLSPPWRLLEGCESAVDPARDLSGLLLALLRPTHRYPYFVFIYLAAPISSPGLEIVFKKPFEQRK